MNVYRFKIDRDKAGSYSCGEAIVAANDAFEAWDTLVEELSDYEISWFNAEICEQMNSLVSLLTKPAVITYNCYVE